MSAANHKLLTAELPATGTNQRDVIGDDSASVFSRSLIKELALLHTENLRKVSSQTRPRLLLSSFNRRDRASASIDKLRKLLLSEASLLPDLREWMPTVVLHICSSWLLTCTYQG